MTAPILITGGTGTLGKLIAARLPEARILSRSTGADLATGEGVAEALKGIDTVIHCAGSQKGDGQKARTLVEHAGHVKHLVNISVVGAERLPIQSALDRAMFGYFAAKREAEQVIEASGIPYTNLRATQFHTLILMTVKGMAKLPLIPVPTGFQFQPVDPDEVAARLVELALGQPQGQVEDLAGPRIYPMRDLLRSYLDASGKHRALVGMRMPGKAARAYREGANLAPDHAVGQRTWEEFLSSALSAAR